MKSIKEKAEEYGLLNPDIHYDADGNTYDDVDKPSMDFEAGANHVLTEILDKTSKCITIKDAYEAFLECVEQLKK